MKLAGLERMSAEFHRTDEVPPPPPSSGGPIRSGARGLVALGALLTTQRREAGTPHAIDVDSAANDQRPSRIAPVQIYSQRSSQLRRALVRTLERKPILAMTLASAAGLFLGAGVMSMLSRARKAPPWPARTRSQLARLARQIGSTLRR